MKWIVFVDAVAKDAEQIAEIVNLAYRGERGTAGWTNEKGLLEGPRVSEDGVVHMIERGRILVARKEGTSGILGCIYIAVDPDGAWHTSMLAVSPDCQQAGIGKSLKEEAERQAVAAKATRMRMEVIGQREALVAWHCRRGYKPTGAKLPFPYHDPSVGQPLRPDLELIVLEKLIGMC